MAMLPIFMMGFIIGLILGYAYGVYRKEVPSDTKLHIMEATVRSLKEDIKLLEETNDNLRKELMEAKLANMAKK